MRRRHGLAASFSSAPELLEPRLLMATLEGTAPHGQPGVVTPMYVTVEESLADVSEDTVVSSVIEHGNVAYVLVRNTPRIERYDITGASWLPSIPLASDLGPATVLHVDDDGLYVGYDNAVYRYDLSGGNQTHVLDAPEPVQGLHSEGSLLFVNHSSGSHAHLTSVNKTTNSTIDTYSGSGDALHGSSLAPLVNRIVGRTSNLSPADITYVTYAEDGTFTVGGDSRYHGGYPEASRTWVFPNGAEVVDDSGTIYSTSSLNWLGNFGGPIDDLDFFGEDTPIVLRNNTLTAYSSSIVATGSHTLAYSPDEIFVNSTHVITFTADPNQATGFQVDLVPLSDLELPPGDPVDPVGLIYTPDDVELAADGSVLLLSKAHQSIFRWDPKSQRYSETIPLRGTPKFMAYSSETSVVYLLYASGLIRQIDLNAAQPVEVPFLILPDDPLGLATAGPFVFAVDSFGPGITHWTFTPTGNLIDLSDLNFSSTDFVWSDANQKMYYIRDDGFPDLLWEQINADGVSYPGENAGGIGQKQESPLNWSSEFAQPIRVAPDGSVVLLGSGKIYDATTLARLDSALSNSVTDATWLGDELFTVRNLGGKTEIQQWNGSTYALTDTVQQLGTAHTLKALGQNRLLSITINSVGIPVFTVMDADLETIEVVDVSDQVTVSVFGRQYNRATGTYSQYVTVTNHSGTPFDLTRLRITDLTPMGVQVMNADGTDDDGTPYFNMLSLGGESAIAPGETSAARVMILAVPPRVAYGFSTNVTAVRGPESVGFTVLESGDETSVDESGTTDSVQVVLNSRPNGVVVLTISSADASEVSVTTSLTFTPDDWDIPQTVTLTGVDDLTVDDDQRTLVTISVDEALSDPGFHSAADQLVAVVTRDNETVVSFVVEHGDVGYFLVENNPRVERYDVVNETWLPSIPLPDDLGPATVLHVDGDGLYVAYGKAVYRYDPDGGNQTHVLDASDDVEAIHSDGHLLFVNHSGPEHVCLVSVDKADNTVIDALSSLAKRMAGSSLAPQFNRIFGRSLGVSPADIAYATYADDGTFIGYDDSPYHGQYPDATRTWVFPTGSKVVDDSGAIYATSGLTWLGTFGDPIDDIAFLGEDVPIVLHGNTLTAYTNSILPTGSHVLGYTPDEIFVNDSHVVIFKADVTAPGGFQVDLVALSELNPSSPGQSVDPVGVPYTPDQVELAADGTLLLYSKAHQSVFRWDPESQSYGQTIPLINTAEYFAYSAETNTIYLAYMSGLIQQIDLDAAQPTETPFITLASRPWGLSTAGPYVFAVDEIRFGLAHRTFGSDGTQIDLSAIHSSSAEYVWSSANQKMYYFRGAGAANDLFWEEINANGVTYAGEPPGGIGDFQDSPLSTTAGFKLPIRVAPDGSVVVLGSGRIHDASTLARLSLSLANSVVDATWLGDDLYTIRTVAGAAELQQWSPSTYALVRGAQQPGTAHSLRTLGGDRLVAITLDGAGIPVFTILGADLEPAPVDSLHREAEASTSPAYYTRTVDAIEVPLASEAPKDTAFSGGGSPIAGRRALDSSLEATIFNKGQVATADYDEMASRLEGVWTESKQKSSGPSALVDNEARGYRSHQPLVEAMGVARPRRSLDLRFAKLLVTHRDREPSSPSVDTQSRPTADAAFATFEEDALGDLAESQLRERARLKTVLRK